MCCTLFVEQFVERACPVENFIVHKYLISSTSTHKYEKSILTIQSHSRTIHLQARSYHYAKKPGLAHCFLKIGLNVFFIQT